eukprot:scaffold57498_cov69-Phaeocystis_antarctica.AAC.1
MAEPRPGNAELARTAKRALMRHTSRAGKNRQARADEAHEPSWGTAKGHCQGALPRAGSL